MIGGASVAVRGDKELGGNAASFDFSSGFSAAGARVAKAGRRLPRITVICCLSGMTTLAGGVALGGGSIATLGGADVASGSDAGGLSLGMGAARKRRRGGVDGCSRAGGSAVSTCGGSVADGAVRAISEGADSRGGAAAIAVGGSDGAGGGVTFGA